MNHKEITKVAWEGFTSRLHTWINEPKTQEGKLRVIEKIESETGVSKVIIQSAARGNQVLVIDGITLYDWYMKKIKEKKVPKKVDRRKFYDQPKQ